MSEGVAAGPGAVAGRAPRTLFVATILVGSFLLFLVQPMVARMALPRLGGAPAVWNSAMLVYQALLLGGYAYAHGLGRLGLRTGAIVHLVLLALAALWLPIGLFAFAMPADAEPALWVPWLLGASIGPLFFAVSAQAPLMQRWYASAEPGRDPYALYAASNVGSFGGLIVYPLLVEPMLALREQSLVWSAGYALLFVLVAGCALLLPRGAGGEGVHHPLTSPSPTARRTAMWVALAFVPSGLMLATSTFITTDIVAVPMLWVLPLGLYLLSFTVAFATRRALAEVITRFAPLTILMFGGVMIGGAQQYPYLNTVMALLLLFMAAVALHSRMYALRPVPDRLTGFYLAMAFGGALGGVFAGLVAPVLFDWTYEYPLLILAAGLLAPQQFLLPVFGRLWNAGRQGVLIRTAAVAVVVAVLVGLGLTDPGHVFRGMGENIAFLILAALGLFVIGMRIPYVIVLFGAIFLYGGYRAILTTLEGDARTRSYFGVYTVRDYPEWRTLAHGTTLHGVELTGSPERERWPTSYYIPGSGVGQAMQAAPTLYGPNARIGVVGLGTGTLACYAQPGQAWRFFEIDPVVVDIARDHFRFLARCLPHPTVEIGDARMRLAEQPPGSLDLLALDAFSSDAIPMHLMTEEAFATYGRVLSPKGLLLVHISNRFLDLEPVVAAAGARGHWFAARLDYHPDPREGEQATISDWIALTRDGTTLARLLEQGGHWQPVRPRRGFRPWTDDYATILPLLRSFRTAGAD
ncbi:spermidine synthase [Sphingomonas sp. DT-204]|uniref:spermidine synthase n=1 Tax=Sphingomonas sp. DT-204 TaxID=3396166 RepID=UPI003F1D79E7